MTISYENVKVT